ncbi:hypothetical protein C8Q79DRAFT_980054 [Trametes meyenii]|nr:hypothetical protein C8Q79DRAFT_980054 [Trametes meyenii]
MFAEHLWGSPWTKTQKICILGSAEQRMHMWTLLIATTEPYEPFMVFATKERAIIRSALMRRFFQTSDFLVVLHQALRRPGERPLVSSGDTAQWPDDLTPGHLLDSIRDSAEPSTCIAFWFGILTAIQVHGFATEYLREGLRSKLPLWDQFRASEAHSRASAMSRIFMEDVPQTGAPESWRLSSAPYTSIHSISTSNKRSDPLLFVLKLEDALAIRLESSKSTPRPTQVTDNPEPSYIWQDTGGRLWNVLGNGIKWNSTKSGSAYWMVYIGVWERANCEFMQEAINLGPQLPLGPFSESGLHRALLVRSEPETVSRGDYESAVVEGWFRMHENDIPDPTEPEVGASIPRRREGHSSTPRRDGPKQLRWEKKPFLLKYALIKKSGYLDICL